MCHEVERKKLTKLSKITTFSQLNFLWSSRSFLGTNSFLNPSGVDQLNHHLLIVILRLVHNLLVLNCFRRIQEDSLPNYQFSVVLVSSHLVCAARIQENPHVKPEEEKFKIMKK